MKVLGQQRPFVDARALGANCDACPLNGTCNPVPPTLTNNPSLFVVAESPGGNEVIAGRPLIGATGMLFNKILRNLREDREGLSISNAILCAPKKGMPVEDWHAAIAACRPRLERELAAAPEAKIIAFGGKALAAFHGTDKIFEHLGVPMIGKIIKREILPILHPSYALPHRAPAYEAVIQIHIKRAFRWAEGKLARWDWPETVTDQDGDEKILAALARLESAPTLGVDVETPKIKDPRDWPRLAKMLLNIGVASSDLKLAVCVTWPKANAEVRAAFRRLLASKIPKTMHNGSFDSKVFRYNGIELGNWDYDSMIAWQIVAPKLKAGLDFVACVLTPAPRWKDEYKSNARIKIAKDTVHQLDGPDQSSRLWDDKWVDGDTLHLGTIGGPDSSGFGIGPSVSQSCVREHRTLRARDAQRECLAGSAPEVAPSTETNNSSPKIGGVVESTNLQVSGSLTHDHKYISKQRLFSEVDVFLGADAVERAIYCARDSYLQDFLRKVQKYYFDEDRKRIFEQRMRLTKIGLKMYHAGVTIDMAERARLRRPYDVKARWALRKVRRLARAAGFERWKEKTAVVYDYEIRVSKKGKEKRVRIKESKRREVIERTQEPFDPGNIYHIRELFARCLGVKGRAAKEEGKEDSFDANVMAEFAKHHRPEVRMIAKAVLDYRKPLKILSTFIDGLPIYEDGKIHIEWKPGQTATLRWASTAPNGQNIPQKLRSMFKVCEGYYLVYADYSQLELRIVALIAKDKPLIAAYLNGIDVHAANGKDIFAAAWEKADEKERANMRDFAKRFVYGANYNAIAKTLWESLVVEFPTLKLSTVVAALKAWFEAHRAIKEWQLRCIDEAYRKDRAEEPILYKHINPFFGNVDPPIAVNFRVQTFASFLVNEMIEGVDKELNWEDGESILFMIHDAVALQVRDPVFWVEKLVDIATKEVEYEGERMKFVVDPAVSGSRLKPVVGVKRNGDFNIPKAGFRWQSWKKLWIELEAASLL